VVETIFFVFSPCLNTTATPPPRDPERAVWRMSYPEGIRSKSICSSITVSKPVSVIAKMSTPFAIMKSQMDIALFFTDRQFRDASQWIGGFIVSIYHPDLVKILMVHLGKFNPIGGSCLEDTNVNIVETLLGIGVSFVGTLETDIPFELTRWTHLPYVVYQRI